MFKYSKIFFIFSLFLGILLFSSCKNVAEMDREDGQNFIALSRGGLSGAIFTTDSLGKIVNGNVYNCKENPSINGGPHPKKPGSAGLPDGDYYFQVTNPSGSVLLSSDDINERCFRVQGGIIIQYLGTTHRVKPGYYPGSICIGLMPYDDTPNPGGEYKVWVTPVERYNPSDPRSKFGFLPEYSKTDNFKINSSHTEVIIYGYKFYDKNTNGQWDPDEVVIPGWKITKTPPLPYDSTYTTTLGQYSFTVPINSGFYTIGEIPPPPGWYPLGCWVATTSTSGTVEVGETDIEGPIFGNVCLGAGGGRTLGFWSNRNGQALLVEGDFTGNGRRYGLNNQPFYRNRWFQGPPTGFGSFPNPAKSNLANYLLRANAVDMRYMLSAQTIAMMLNVNHGFVDPQALVYAPGVPSANSAGFTTIENLINDAIMALNGTNRQLQEIIKDALDAANNNKTFVLPDPCDFDSPY